MSGCALVGGFRDARAVLNAAPPAWLMKWIEP
jgi:hypothetical protein